MGLILLRKQPQKLAVVRQYLITILASLPFAVAGAAIAWPSPTLARVLSGGETFITLDIAEISWMVSLLYLGEAVGTLPCVFLSNKIGRRKTLLYSGVLSIISWSILLTSDSSLGLYISRFLAGLQIGVVNVVYPLYILEISQSDIRSPLTALSTISLNAGIFFVSVVGPFVLPYVLVLLVLLLSGLFPTSFQFAPESPHYLLRRDDITGARNSLSWLRGGLNRIELEFELDRIEKNVKTQLEDEKFSAREMFFSKMLRRDLIFALILSALDGLSGVNVIQAYATATFPKTAFGILTPNDCIIVITSATFFSSFIAAYASHIFQRRKFGAVSYCGSSFTMAVVAIWFFSKSKTEVNISSIDYVPFFGCLVHFIICCFIHSSSLNLIKSQNLSAKVTLVLNTLCTITKSTVSFFLNKIYFEIADREGVYVNFIIYSASCFMAAVFSAAFWDPLFGDGTVREEQDSSIEEDDEISKCSLNAVNGAY